ncbi:uncharacterized protein LOC132930188 isoform X2 [Rhopalosiphum padi]|uniref:uncharacterized protein LOC132930188 isoform X2 n=1 Tax=Rhopalosiphum padi TaxID=40932 RepID=UPI00298DAAA4|nr:uncharacterized protein LOC132930188 isoform X2 [Rhopalosiphum padi]
MNVKTVNVLILWILVIGGLVVNEGKLQYERNCQIVIGDGGLICTDVEYKSHSDDYDITTICKTTSVNNAVNSLNDAVNGLRCYDVKIHLRTNAIGMPINLNGFIPSSDRKSLEFIADRKYQTTLNNIFTRNQITYNTTDWAMTALIMSNGAVIPKDFYYNLLLWKANTAKESFNIKWTQRNSVKMCISISYLLRDESKCTLSLDVSQLDRDHFEKKIMHSYDIKESKDLKTVLFKNDNWLHENKTYSLNFKLLKKTIEKEMYSSRYQSKYYTETVYVAGCTIGIKRIAQCTDEYENEDILTINEKELQDTPSNASLTVDIYPFDYEPRQKLLIPQSLGCFNGGFANQNRCICPPGFKGNNCEYGCGSNRFGTDCTGMCSIHQTQCRQMIFCTKGFGCKCPAGYSGFNCTKECTSGTYGVDCEQQCPEGCRLKSCNVYTGVCNKGCTASYIAPDCKEKYPWLKSPPKLESSDYRSLKLKIDLNTDNIQGSNNIKSVYYQIIFKIVSNESEFQYLELKEIGDQKSIIEITDNLKPGISYTFGVILVSEDGNNNIEDIKIVNYSTRCLLPKSTNYNVNLMSGTDNINVTWNKLNDQNEEDCKIMEYLLKLMYYNTDLKQLNYSEEVKSNNNHGYIFENLLSGEKYAVQVTAITATGQAEPSMLSYIYTEPYGQIQIKNIKIKFNENSSLIITWDIDEKYASTSLVYEIKYKVNKHFSCSNKIITNNWTSLLVYNKTRQEISNLIPNTQYIIKIDPKIKGYTYDDYSNMIYVKTPISKPKLKPVINDENSSYITNQSAYFNWKMNMTECSKLNGFFRGYQIILKNIVEGTQVVESIKENTVSYNELKPDNKYEVQIYVLTNDGYNIEQGLLIPFKTKTKFLVPVDELIVYKKNLKKKSIGIRWSYPDENVINGFIVIAIDENLNSTKQIIIEPAERCVAWPSFYCTTFDNLIPNNQYTIKIKAKSLDYPTGGSTASVVTNFNDGFSDKPENLRTTDVGSTYISLEWDIPWILNGVLKSFIVNIEEISSQDIEKCCDSKPDLEVPVTEELPTYNCTVQDLKPGSTYSIGVLSKTSSYGQTSKIHVKTVQSTFTAVTGVEHEKPIQLEANTTSDKPNVL